MRFTPWLLVVAACTAPDLGETNDSLTTVIPASDTCSQGIGASWCIQTPVFDAKSSPAIDGKRETLEYAGAVTVPFTTDDNGPPKVQGSGTIFLKRVKNRTSDDLFVFFENIPVGMHDTANPPTSSALIELYVDNNRFTGTDANTHAEDRRYTIDLNGGTNVQIQRPTGTGTSTTWSTTTGSATFQAGGCRLAATGIGTCNGELRFTLDPSAMQAAPGLMPGIGIEARGFSGAGTGPELPATHWTTVPYTVTDYQTVLFGRPRGTPLSFMQFNVRRFASFWEQESFGEVSVDDMAKFISAQNPDVLAIEEGWDRDQVQKIVADLDVARLAAHQPPYVLYGPIDFEPDASQVMINAIDAVSEQATFSSYDTQGGIWLISWLPLAGFDTKPFTSDACRGEDCLKAKGVMWARFKLQDPTAYDPVCLKEHPAKGCNQAPSGDQFVDVFTAHLNADDPEFCSDAGFATWDLWKVQLYSQSAILAALGNPVNLITATAIDVLVATDLNCATTTDKAARAKQLDQMSSFITQHAAPDRPSIVMADLNIDGKHVQDNVQGISSEYELAMVKLGIAPASASDTDLISVMAGGPDLQHGDVMKDSKHFTATGLLGDGQCAGTMISEAQGNLDANCQGFAGDIDAPLRLDYILVRPPALPNVAVSDPRWIAEAGPAAEVWSSPFPSLGPENTLAVPMTPARLSDHKPVMASIELARLQNPPKYHPLWHHNVEQRIISVDATGFADCWLCGEVDPFALLISQITPGLPTAPKQTTECEDHQTDSFAQDACMNDWFLEAKHTPPNETAISLVASVADDDNTSANDTLDASQSLFRYADGAMLLNHFAGTGPVPTSAWSPNTEETPQAMCDHTPGSATVCHQTTVMPVPLGH